SKLLRWTIDHKEDKITFFDEIGLIYDYVNLMNMRQKNKIELEVEVTQEAYQQMVPRFLLQPLIENSIIHGLNQGSGRILIKAEVYDDIFEIKISDNGEGMDASQLAGLNQSIRSSDSMKRSKKGFSSI